MVCLVSEITVKAHVDGELRDYALYTIYDRAIPSMIDGLKPSQRKAVYTASKVARNKQIKTIALTGYTYPCLVGDTEISCSDGSYVTIRELADLRADVDIECVDTKTNSRVLARTSFARKTKEVTETITIKDETGTVHEMTPNHLILCEGNVWKEAQNIVEGDNIVSLSP